MNKFVGVLTPPCIRVASPIIGALLAAEQGVKNISLVYTVNLGVIQDVATQRVMRRLCRDYMKRLGYKVNVMQGISHYVGAHPDDHARAFAYVALVAVVARWGGANRIETRTIDEGVGIPSMESQAMSLRATREMLYLLRNQDYPESADLAEECQVIEREARAIIDKVLELGDGDIAVGAVKALETGALDYTYPVNKNIMGRVTSVRDGGGAVRMLDCGNLPFTAEMKGFHRRKIAERRKAGDRKDYQMIIEDLTGRSLALAK
ncbi:MAG: methylaspartate mutase subunit E, partial [Chloroflexi bacterium]|nr:methylaspartate mutase subunit E [Chloroflexota bacterium]